MDLDTHRISLEKPAFGGENEVSPQHNEPSPPSTNSMITVRLSDTMFEFPAVEMAYEPVGDDLAGDEMPKPEINQTLIKEGKSRKRLEHHSFQFLDNDFKKASLGNGDWRASRSINEVESSRSTLGSFRSRSESSGTSSSVASAHVDWDELDKSEEQAPRDECSDEVCFHWTNSINVPISDVAQVNCVSTCQARAGKQCFGNRPKGSGFKGSETYSVTASVNTTTQEAGKWTDEPITTIFDGTQPSANDRTGILGSFSGQLFPDRSTASYLNLKED